MTEDGIQHAGCLKSWNIRSQQSQLSDHKFIIAKSRIFRHTQNITCLVSWLLYVTFTYPYYIPIYHTSYIILSLYYIPILHTQQNIKCIPTWWFIPLSKWVITPVISGLTLLIPFITGVITHLLSEMSHQVILYPLLHPHFFVRNIQLPTALPTAARYLSRSQRFLLDL